jgi:hypothetical protein
MSKFKVSIEMSCHKNTHIKYESPITYHSKWPMLKFLKSRSNFKVKRSKILVPTERSCHKEYTYEISSKDIANVKSF